MVMQCSAGSVVLQLLLCNGPSRVTYSVYAAVLPWCYCHADPLYQLSSLHYVMLVPWLSVVLGITMLLPSLCSSNATH